MTIGFPSSPNVEPLPSCLESLLPAGTAIQAQAKLGRSLVLALTRGSHDGGVGWFDLAVTEPRWQPAPGSPNTKPGRPIHTLLADGQGLVAVAADRISVYHWRELEGELEIASTFRLPLYGYQIFAAGQSKRHLAILASRIHRRPGKGSTVWHDLGRSAPTHRRTELLLLMEANGSRELGAAALEQWFDASIQAPPPSRWTNLRLSETHLHLQDSIAGPIQVTLGDGPMEDLQQQIDSCISQLLR